jgi:hypothetical protein
MMPEATLNAAIARLCGPHTGVTVEDIFRRAKAAQDHRAGDTMHGHVPRWEDLGAAEQEDLALRTAEQWQADFDTARPDDPRPVDHYSASSPPWPDGLAERNHWTAWCRSRVDELAVMAAAQGPEHFVRGRLNEAQRWARLLQQRGQSAPIPGGTGADEVAWWIVELDARAHRLDGRGSATDLAKGEAAEIGDYLWRLRNRQMHRGSPMFWHHGGRGLLAALGWFAEARADLTDAVVVVAAHDAGDQSETIRTQQRDVVAILRAWTARDTDACEQAIRRAHAGELVDGRTPREVTTTLRGDRVYRDLLNTVGAPSVTPQDRRPPTAAR